MAAPRRAADTHEGLAFFGSDATIRTQTRTRRRGMRARSTSAAHAELLVDHDAFARQMRRMAGENSPLKLRRRRSSARMPPLHKLLDAVVARLPTPSPAASPTKQGGAAVGTCRIPKWDAIEPASGDERHAGAADFKWRAVPPRAGPLAAVRSSRQVLPQHLKKDVLDLFEGFALAQQQKPVAPPQPRSLRPPVMPLRAAAATNSAGLLTGAAVAARGGGAQPTSAKTTIHRTVDRFAGPAASMSLPAARKSFEALLRLYYRTATPKELAAMLELVAPEMSALVRGTWVARTKSQHGSAIAKTFARVDADGSGGIDLDEFLGAVAEARTPIDEERMRALFAAGDKDGNGVLSLDEFMNLLSQSAELVEAFGDILSAANAKQLRTESKRLSAFLKSSTICSPSGRKRRPSLNDLRPMDEVDPFDAAMVPRERAVPARGASGAAATAKPTTLVPL